MADQQRTLSHFLSGQQDSTEISFFSASSDKQATDYRGAICRQLGGHQVGSFIRPLQQLLSDPVDGLVGTGPYLVCITQAEHLDSTFLQELWDWVMHSQKGNEGIHLNIILFGESAWAKSSQEWLPIQNSHKPVLLSSQLIDPVGFDVNALEALMADKSSWFSTSNQPLVTNKWFISSVLSVFLVVFVGLMAWQYPAQFASIFSGDSVIASKIDNNATAESTLYAKSTEVERQAIVNKEIGDIIDTKNINTESNAYLPQLEVVEPKQSAFALGEGAGDAYTNRSSSITSTLLVSNWSDSVASANNKNAVVDATNKGEKQNDLSNDAALNLPNEENIEQTEIAQQSPQILASVVNAEGDFQVPDIISVAQLDAQLNNDSLVNLATELAPEYPKQQNSIQSDQPISILDNSAIDYQFDETTLLLLPTDSIVLQLSGIQNPVILETYLNNNNLKASTWVYETQRYGGPWYVVLYRQSFDSIETALKQLSSLPDDVREAQPFAKSINQIQQEINRR